MYFSDLYSRLLAQLQRLVWNGELTERGLARVTGISQPHIHHVLAGKRKLSPEYADKVMRYLQMGVEDLLAGAHHGYEKSTDQGQIAVSFLTGMLGPQHAWPAIVGQEVGRVAQGLLHGMENPLLVRLGLDEQMSQTLQAGQFALLDQNLRRRRRPQSGVLYAVRWGNRGLVRWLEWQEGVLYLVTDENRRFPSRWKPLAEEGRETHEIVLAQVIPLGEQVQALAAPAHHLVRR